MPFICYEEKQFTPERFAMIERTNDVIDEYKAQGYDLTLRQVYYQMVAADIIPNNERSYKNLGNLINDGRLAGLIDWDAIEDRTRYVRKNAHWTSPASMVRSAAASYHTDHWRGQDYHVEVWVEKDALIGIVSKICEKLDVAHFSCRGYTSQTAMWDAAQRMIDHQDAGKQNVLLHLGDHDPSGIDMSRDIPERLELFGVNDLLFRRMALNMHQVEEYGPPPNPAKLSDSRAGGYIKKYGTESWELDALRPQVIAELIESNVTEFRDDELYKEVVAEQEEARSMVRNFATNYDELADNWDDINRDYLT